MLSLLHSVDISDTTIAGSDAAAKRFAPHLTCPSRRARCWPHFRTLDRILKDCCKLGDLTISIEPPGGGSDDPGTRRLVASQSQFEPLVALSITPPTAASCSSRFERSDGGGIAARMAFSAIDYSNGVAAATVETPARITESQSWFISWSIFEQRRGWRT
jgi:hypothetical protein